MTEDQRSLLLALAISLICHGLLLWLMPRLDSSAPVRPQKIALAVRLAARPAPPPVPPPPAEPLPRPAITSPPSPQPTPRLTRPTPSAASVATVPAVEDAPPPPQAPPALPVPPRHQMKAAGNRAAGSGRPDGVRAGQGSIGTHVYAPPDYAEKVKTRVNAAIVYPADARRFLQQCWVEYTLTVDRNGNLLNYRIENCGDDRLDAAAQAALIKGGPYPSPPDSGAESYEIHGALVFTLQ
ncbi:MAG: TonB C-terminal domain-containing protein [Sterolibacterium sp.]|nr:TonB C-terminal domain-containing protein [Sterolibacterium sp.]